MREIFIDAERCTACKTCETSCAVEHSASQDLFTAIFESPRPQTRIHVEKANGLSYPVRCMHCRDAACIIACPTGAMHREADFGAVQVNDEKCMGCFMCAMVCPFGAISAHSDKKIAVKCDFCTSRLRAGELPACVEGCPTSALIYGEEQELVRQKRLSAAAVGVMAISRAREERTKVSSIELIGIMGGN